MSAVLSRLKTIVKSKTFSEMIDKTPKNYIEFMAAIPLFLFMVLPLWQLIHNFISPAGHNITFSTKVNGIFLCEVTVGTIALILHFAKSVRTNGKPSLKSLIKNNIPMIFFVFVILMMIISTLINGFTNAALYGDIYRRESIFYFIAYFSLYFLSGSIITDKKIRTALLYTFIAISIPVAVFTFIDEAFIPMKAFELCVGVSSVYHQFNHYGYYLILVILASAALFSKSKKPAVKILCLCAFTANTILLIINDTFGCYLACVIALVFNCVVTSLTEKKVNKKSIVILGLFAVITLIMSFKYHTVLSNFFVFANDVGNVAGNPENSGTAGTGRWTLWTHTMGYITEKPLFGFGVEGTNARLYAETHGVNDRPHNEFLEYAVFFGIPAAVSYICGVFSVYLNGLKNRLKLDSFAIAALVAAFAYLVSSVFGNTMYYTAPYLFIMLGLGFAKCPEENNEQN